MKILNSNVKHRKKRHYSQKLDKQARFTIGSQLVGGNSSGKTSDLLFN